MPPEHWRLLSGFCNLSSASRISREKGVSTLGRNQIRKDMAMENLTAQSFKNKVFNYDTEQDWKYLGQRPAIIDFYADWCGPCKAVAPILEEVSKDYSGKVDIFKINVDTEPELASMFGVRGIPTLLFIPQTGAPQASSGALPRKAFDEIIEKFLGVKGA
jgi:thioredoxin